MLMRVARFELIGISQISAGQPHSVLCTVSLLVTYHYLSISYILSNGEKHLFHRKNPCSPNQAKLLACTKSLFSYTRRHSGGVPIV